MSPVDGPDAGDNDENEDLGDGVLEQVAEDVFLRKVYLTRRLENGCEDTDADIVEDH